jgi:hypothetical protein
MKTTPLLAPAIGVGLLLAACGDDPLTKDEFVERADALCAETQAEAAPIWESAWSDVESAGPSTGDGQAFVFVRMNRAVDELMPLFRGQLESIGELEPPSDDAELIGDLLDDFDAALAEFADLMDAAAAGDETAMAALEQDDPMVEVNRRAREYGLTVCGDDS